MTVVRASVRPSLEKNFEVSGAACLNNWAAERQTELSKRDPVRAGRRGNTDVEQSVRVEFDKWPDFCDVLSMVR